MLSKTKTNHWWPPSDDATIEDHHSSTRYVWAFATTCCALQYHISGCSLFTKYPLLMMEFKWHEAEFFSVCCFNYLERIEIWNDGSLLHCVTWQSVHTCPPYLDALQFTDGTTEDAMTVFSEFLPCYLHVNNNGKVQSLLRQLFDNILYSGSTLSLQPQAWQWANQSHSRCFLARDVMMPVSHGNSICH